MPNASAATAPTAAVYASLAEQVEAQLRAELRCFFPRAVNATGGGFTAGFGPSWKPLKEQTRHLVFQSRMTWVAAQVVLRRPDLADEFRSYVRHGVSFLQDVMWDRDCGGFYWELDAAGSLSAEGSNKHAYGIGFAVYALAAAHQALSDARSLELVQAAFRWLDNHGHDTEHGGYWEAFDRRGGRLTSAAQAGAATNPYDAIGTFYGYKALNTHLHLMEALIELYRAWPDAVVRQRLEELLAILRDRIAVQPGCLNLYFTPAWRPLPDHDSFGHDVEAGFLLVEAAGLLGFGDDAATHAVARSLVDHALAFGYDRTRGGLYDKGSAFQPAFDRNKVWWAQAEFLNALLLMHELHGRSSQDYFEAFEKSWRFVLSHQIDRRHGGWREVVTHSGDERPLRPKSQNWKSCYHTGRALLNISDRLRRLSRIDSA
jgi:mannobiose 2-epimerase